MSDQLMPPQPGRTDDEFVDDDDARCVRDALALLVAEFDQLGPPGALLRAEMGRLHDAGADEPLRALRGLLSVCSMLVQSLALETGERPDSTLAALALDIERLYPSGGGSKPCRLDGR